jgi:hypothetical protein
MRATKSRRLKWVGHVECNEEIINSCTNMVEKSQRKNHLGD